MIDTNESKSELVAPEERLTREILGSKDLTKSVFDEFSYALKLKTGESIWFSSATVLNKEWIHIEGVDISKSNGLAHVAARGIDIRISEIVWVMDAPEGS